MFFLFCPYFERERELFSFWTVFIVQIFLGAFMATCFTGEIFFFFFPQCFLKAFNQRLITVHVGWAHEGVKHWPRKFFSKCRQQDSNQGAHLIEPSTSTLRPRAQPTWPTPGLRLRLCKTIIQYRGEFVTLLDHLLLTFSCPIYQAYWMTTIII